MVRDQVGKQDRQHPGSKVQYQAGQVREALLE
ncbi:uncharacterized, partial [Tachysurus ichikawai]